MTVTERTERGPGRQARDRATVGSGTREEFASCDPATGDVVGTWPVDDATTVVLYAPTYRDDEVAGVDVPLAVDLEALADRLGPDHLLLLRKHYYLGHQRPVPDSVRVRDVSAEPDICSMSSMFVPTLPMWGKVKATIWAM